MNFTSFLGGLALGAATAAILDNVGRKALLGQGVVQGGPSGGGGSFGGPLPSFAEGPGGPGEVQSVEPIVTGPGFPGGSFFGISAPAYMWPINVNPRVDRFGRPAVAYGPPRGWI